MNKVEADFGVNKTIENHKSVERIFSDFKQTAEIFAKTKAKVDLEKLLVIIEQIQNLPEFKS